MRHLKMLGLAAVSAVALIAFIGIGSAAAATTLCSTNTNPCTGTTYGLGTIIKTELKEGTEGVLKTGFATIKCKHVSGEGEIQDFSEATGAPTGKNIATPFAECNCTLTTLKNGSLEVTTETPGTPNGNGTLIGKETEVTATCGGVSCIYGTSAAGTVLGKVTGGNPAVVKINAKVPWFAGDASNAICTLGTGVGSMTAEMVATAPNPLFIE